MAGVLLIDDEVMTLHFLRRLIDWEAEGFSPVGEALSVSQALRLAEEICPDIVISDMRMPMMDGVELGRRILETCPSCKIIFLTAYRDFDCAKRAVQLGAFDYLLKHELDRESLLRSLRRARREQSAGTYYRETGVRQCLRDLAAGRPYSEQVFGELSQSAKRFWALLARRDFPLLGPDAGGAEPSAEPPDAQDGSPLRPVGRFRLEGGAWVLLCGEEPAASGALLRQALHALGEAWVRQACGEKESVSVFLTPLDGLLGLRGAVKRLQEAAALDYRDPGAVHFLDEVTPITLSARPDERRLGRLLDQGDQQGFDAAISELFGPLLLQGRVYSGVQQAAGQVAGVLEQARAFYGLPPAAPGNGDSEGLRRTLEFLRRGSREITACERENTAHLRRVRLALSYMEEHFTQDVSCRDIAAFVGVSGGFLRRLLKQETGMSLVQYVNHLRIERAKALLLDGRHKVRQVAQMCGFNTVQYFCQVFKAATGQSPLDYLNSRGEKP